jgi:hypothetical protein
MRKKMLGCDKQELSRAMSKVYECKFTSRKGEPKKGGSHN